MTKLLNFLIIFMLIAVCSLSAIADPNDVIWDNESADNLWSNPLNWDTNHVPIITDRAILDKSTGEPNKAVIDVSVSDIASLWVGQGLGGYLQILSGGQLTTSEMFSPVSGATNAQTDVNGGTLSSSPIYLGYSGNAEINISNSGVVNATTLYCGYGSASTGTINVTGGGTLNCSALSYVGWQDVFLLGPSEGEIIIDGGTVNAPAGLWMSYLDGSKSLLEVYSGGLNITGSGSSLVVGYTTGDAQASFLGGTSTIDIIYLGFNSYGSAVDANLYVGSGATVTCTAAASGLNVGWFGKAQAIIDGGTLSATYGYISASGAGLAGGSNMVINADSDVDFTTALYVGSGGEGHLEVNGGTLDVWNLIVSYTGAGYMTVNDGAVTVGAGGLPVGYWGYTGELNITGGSVYAPVVLFGATGLIDISGTGQLILAGNQIANVDSWVTSGNLTANGTQRAVKRVFNGVNTIVTYDVDLAKAAWNPSPLDAVIVNGNQYDSTILSWSSGVDAQSHDVYFGTNENAVSDANTTSAEYQGNQLLGNETFDPGTLALGQTYYWRIDEIDGSTVKGTVWSFTLPSFIALDDFESYADTTALQAVWSGASSLSTTLANDGAKSMTVDYNNSSSSFYSEAVRSYAGTPIDLTQAGVQAIHVWFHGVETNTADKVYVRLTDTLDANATVIYDDANDIIQPIWQTTSWNQFAIDLTDFSGVDLTNIKEIALGVGTGSAGGIGTVYFDDLRIYLPVYVSSYAQEAGDVYGDEIINFKDHAVLASVWMESPATINATTASNTGLRAYYQFENDTNDSSGNGFHASAPFGEAYDTGYTGQSFDMRVGSPFTYYLDINNGTLFSTITDEMTVAFWAYGDASKLPASSNFIQASNAIAAPVKKYFFVNIALPGGWFYCDTAENGGGSTVLADGVALPYDRISYLAQATSDFAGQWNHYAFVKNALTGFQGMYINGVMVSGGFGNTGTVDGIGQMWINDGLWSGRVDEFRIYDRALSQGEIIDLAGLASVSQPVVSNGLFALPDLDGDDDVDVFDLEIMAENWLIKPIFP